MNNQTTPPLAKIEKRHIVSSIWFLPFIAMLLGGWILIQHLTHANTEIKIHFDSADSIITDKTKIRYKGVIIGTVKKIELNENAGVNIIAEIESHATFMLRENAQFWLVSPKATLTSISGLDTVFSGSYINLLPGDGDKTDTFNALSEQPINIPDSALLINLQSESAGSINVGTPIFFKKIKVGEVAQVKLSESNQAVDIKAFIEKKYEHLIKQQSKFWNISGLQANLSRTGLNLQVDSLSSLIAGGITFSSPKLSPIKEANQTFKLFENIDKTEMGLAIELTLKNIANLPKNAGILFNGLGIGHLADIKYDSDKKSFVAKAVINPQFNDMITKGAQFWVEKTTLSFSKIANVGNIISGNYIAFLPDNDFTNQQPKSQFIVHDSEQPTVPPITIKLQADNANGITTGAPINYQGIEIGKINNIDFSDNGQHIDVLINIENKYQYLINKHSHFYLLSGINIDATVSRINIQTAPVGNLVSGGIGLYNSEPVSKTNHATFNKEKTFRLYPSKQMAKIGKNIFSAPLKVNLLSKELPSIYEGSPIYYHKFTIGEVSAFSIDNSGLIKTEIKIKSEYKHLIKYNSVFWNISGINVEAGLSGIKLQAESLLTIATGGIAVDTGTSEIENKYSNGAYKLFDNYQQATQKMQDISIIFDQAYDLQVGSKLRMKGIEIGEVSTLTLNDSKKVVATATIRPEYSQEITHQNTRFWIVKSELSLSGAKNLSTLVSGVYLNVLPGKGSYSNQFIGESKPPTLDINQQGLNIILTADNAGSTDIGSPVYHRQIQIGQVIDKQLSTNASGVEIKLNIYPQYAHLIRINSIFWAASGFNIDIGITGAALKATSLAALLRGGISMSTDDSVPLQPASPDGKHFELHKEMKDKWLTWRLAIPKK
jgi:paraquat-inducible protein B